MDMNKIISDFSLRLNDELIAEMKEYLDKEQSKMEKEKCLSNILSKLYVMAQMKDIEAKNSQMLAMQQLTNSNFLQNVSIKDIIGAIKNNI